MDVSSPGTTDTALFLQRSQAMLQGPLNAIKQQENAALMLAQTLSQSLPSTPPSGSGSLNGLGQVVDVTV